MYKPINDIWRFSEEFTSATPDISKMEPVRIPHTVKLMDFNCISEEDYQMVSCYAAEIFVGKDREGKRTAIQFDGAAHRAEVYCNGEFVTEHRCGYSSFIAELDPYLRYGEKNLITVKLDSRETLNQPPFGKIIDYMTFGGLYREVFLIETEKSYIDDVFISGDMYGQMNVRFRASDPEGKQFRIRIDELDYDLTCDASLGEFTDEFEDCLLWDTDSPALYTAECFLIENGSVIDTKEVRFGFRSIRFDSEGFFLNERRIQLRGLNRHQSWPYIGYAAPERMQKLDADILKNELKCNVVRTSHYPQSQHFIDRCDEIGLLVFTEIPGWQHIGDDEWKNQAVENTKDMILQYRNHPSIFMWGVRINESLDDDELYFRTNVEARKLDGTRPLGGVRYITNSTLYEDVYTFNDFIHNGSNEGCRERDLATPHADKGYMITEHNGHMNPTKPFDDEEQRLSQALRHAKVINDSIRKKGIAGCTGWCMFDYNTHREFGSGDRICYHGVMDQYRIEKLASSVYRSQSDDEPYLEISSDMDPGEYKEGLLGQLVAFTNCSKVMMYRNDMLIGTYRPYSRDYCDMIHPPIFLSGNILDDAMKTNDDLDDDEIAQLKKDMADIRRGRKCDDADLLRLYDRYEKNWNVKDVKFRFVAYQDDEPVIQKTIAPGDSYDLKIDADTTTLHEKGCYDAATVRMRYVNNWDRMQRYANRVLQFETEGPIELMGPNPVPLTGGGAACYIRTTGRTGKAKLTIKMGNITKTVDFTVE